MQNKKEIISLADQIRDELLNKGVIIEDQKERQLGNLNE
jgi:cysteinyl-tRNA synthetase